MPRYVDLRLRAGVRWIADQEKSPGYSPVPDRALPPEVPISVISLPLTEAAISAQFIDAPGTNPRRVSVKFGKGMYSGDDFIYATDDSGRIVRIAREPRPTRRARRSHTRTDPETLMSSLPTMDSSGSHPENLYPPSTKPQTDESDDAIAATGRLTRFGSGFIVVAVVRSGFSPNRAHPRRSVETQLQTAGSRESWRRSIAPPHVVERRHSRARCRRRRRRCTLRRVELRKLGSRCFEYE